MKSNTCSRCVAHYDPNDDDDACAVFCGDCTRRLNRLANEAETYQRRIKAGDINVCPENPADHRTVRRIIKRRLTTEPDTKMPTWRDRKK